MKTDNITLIIPFKKDSNDRERNLTTILKFNLKIKLFYSFTNFKPASLPAVPITLRPCTLAS